MAAKTEDVRTLLAKLARAHAGVVEGVSCAGTKLEARTWSVGKRAFLHVGNGEPAVLRFKLDQLAASASRHGVEVGSGGWSKLVLAAGDKVPAALASWVAESYALMGGAPVPANSRAAKKTAKRR